MFPVPDFPCNVKPMLKIKSDLKNYVKNYVRETLLKYTGVKQQFLGFALQTFGGGGSDKGNTVKSVTAEFRRWVYTCIYF